MTDDQFLLASAYADGDVTQDERARAEADPEVMAEVGRIERRRLALADVAPAPADARAAMIAAAMAEFAPAASTSAAAVVPIGSRRSASRPAAWSRPLGLVAAAIAVLAVGAVVVQSLGGGEDGDDSFATTATEPGVVDLTAESAERTIAPDADAAEDATQLVESGAAATEAPAAAPRTDATLEMAADLAAIDGPADLASVGAQLAADWRLGIVEPIEPDCTFAAALGAPTAKQPESGRLRADLPAAGEDVLLFDTRDYTTADGPVVPVFVAVDIETTQAYAIDAAACALVDVGTTPRAAVAAP